MNVQAKGPSIVGNRWEILRPLARGGMGVVYVARHRVTGAQAALKLLEGAYHDADYERFQREAHAATSIGHPGIVQVLDADICAATGSPYLAMELLTGQTLRELLDDPSSTPTHLITRIRQLLEPLAAAHQKGIVHRDLKPENIFVVDAGSFPVKLLDFGISRSMGTIGVTQAGTGIGTPHYMSPEQAIDARSVTLASDVWAIGAMLFEALSGRPPFDGDNTNVIIVRLCTEPPPKLAEIVEDVNPRLADLVDRCLAKSPDRRPADASALMRELDAVLRPDSLPLSRPPPRRSASVDPHSRVRRITRVSDPVPRSVGPSRRVHHTLMAAAAASATLVVGSLAALLALGQADPWVGFGVTGALLGSAVLIGAVALLFRRARRARPASAPEVASRCSSLPSSPSSEPSDRPKTLEAVLYLDPTHDASRRATKVLAKLADDYGRRLQCSIRVLATPGRKRGQRFAEAAVEARTQGADAGFERFLEAQLAHPVGGDDQAMEARLGELGFNLVSWRHAWRVRRHQRQVEADRAAAARVGVVHLPTFVIGGRALKTDTPVEVIRDVIDAALARSPDQDRGEVGEPTYQLPANPEARFVRLQQILVQWSALEGARLSTPRTRAQAQELARTLLKRAHLHACNFAQLGHRFSDGQVDMGVLRTEELEPGLRRIALGLAIGETSRELVTSDDGIRIVRRVG